jgi:hypothetical protein
MKTPGNIALAGASSSPRRSERNMEFTYSHVIAKHMFAMASAQAFSCDSLTNLWAGGSLAGVMPVDDYPAWAAGRRSES